LAVFQSGEQLNFGKTEIGGYLVL